MAKSKVRVFVVLFCILGLALLIAEQSPLALFRHGETGIDSSVFKYVATEMQDGKVPYVDTFDHKGPLLYIINYVGNLIVYYRGVWIFEFLSIFLALLAFYKIARLTRLDWKFSLLSVLIVSAPLCIFYNDNSGNYAQVYALPMIAWSAYIFLEYFLKKETTRIKLLVAGATLGGVVLLQANLAVSWIVFSIGVLVFAIKNKRQKDLPKFILYFLIGFMLVVVPILLWLALNGALEAYFYANFTFNAMYSTEGGRWAKYIAAFYYLNNSLFLITSGYLLYRVTRKRDFVDIVNLLFFVAVMVVANLSGRLYAHYQIVTVPILIYPFSQLLFLFSKEKEGVKLLACGSVLVFYALPIWAEVCKDNLKAFSNRNNDQISSVVREVVDVVDKETGEEEKISVYGNWNIIYILSNRRSASKYSYQFDPAAIDEQILIDYLADLDKNSPKLVIMEPEYFSGGREQDSVLIEFLENHNYKVFYETEGRNDKRGALVYRKENV